MFSEAIMWIMNIGPLTTDFRRDSIRLISYAGCLGPSPITSEKIHSFKYASQPEIAKNSLKTPIHEVQGRSRSSMLVPLESSSAVLVMVSSKCVSICNHSRARLVDSSRNRALWRAYINLTPSCGVSHMCFNRYRIVTDGRTDGQTDRHNYDI